MSVAHHPILIVGGGTAGISVAARLVQSGQVPAVTVVEPAATHYYQPLWTLVGGGVFDKSLSARPMGDVMPAGVTWIRDAVDVFDPAAHQVTLRSGSRLSYEQLVVAPGIQLDWHKIEGLPAALGQGGVCRNYSFASVDATWQAIRGFQGGTALFTFPSTPVKCAGAPQKIMWLAEHHFRKAGVRARSKIVFASAGARIFGVDKYARALEKLVAERDIDTRFKRDLVAVRPASREAVFRATDSGETETIRYDLLHVSPPMSAPDFVKRSPLANADGWVEVDPHTTQHARFPDVFALGDASSLPCSKTGAAIRKQAPITVANLLAHRAGKPLPESYDGYASCPLVTGYGRLILAEFGYGGKIMETFPFDQAQERYSMYALKAYALPNLYWHGLLKGRA